MKTTSAILRVICILAAAGLAIAVVIEHQARFKLDQENRALHQQLSRMDEFIAENQRLSNVVAQASSSPSRSNERVEELLRLRGEVEALRHQSKEIESLREDTRQVRAAQSSGLNTQHAGQPAKTDKGTAANGSKPDS